VKRLACALALVVASLVSVGDAATSAAAGTPPLNGRILFVRCARHCQLYTVNPDGTALHRITSEGDNGDADWSPDGTKIAYASTRSGDLTIWISRADGSHARQLTPNRRGSDDLWPRFTPDGRRVLFVNCEGGDCDGGIGSVRLDGSRLHLVTPNSHSSYNLADQSPDGSRMTYMRWHVDGVKMGIYVSDADGSNEQRVSPPLLQGWLPDWSPTGDRIVFASQVFFDRPSPVLYSVQPDGTGLQQLTTPGFPHADWAPAYSPDGTMLVFNSDRGYDDLCCGDLYTMDADGGPASAIPLPFDAYDPRWGTAPLQASATSTAAARRGSGMGTICRTTPFAVRLVPGTCSTGRLSSSRP
jgi:Tol biopolymer transport system component